MHIYLDESGNPAPLVQPSATRHFVLVALVIPGREDLERAIQQLRRQLRFDKEFKSHATPHHLRVALLELALTNALYFDVMAVDKESLAEVWNRRGAMELYQAMAGELLLEVTQPLRNAILIVDEIDEYQTEALRKSVRSAISTLKSRQDVFRRVRRVSGHDSKRDDLLQLADVVAGSVFRACERGDARCLDVIRSRVQWHGFSGEKKDRDR
jgi:Protein of unknown function (DUF3800)